MQALGGIHAPALVWPVQLLDGDVDFLWMEQAQGRHLYLLNASEARQLGRSLRAIHEMPIDGLQVRLEAPTWDDYFQNRLLAQLAMSRSHCPSDLHGTLESLLKAIRNFGMKFGNRLAGHGQCLVHTDLIPLNVLFDEDLCILIGSSDASIIRNGISFRWIRHFNLPMEPDPNSNPPMGVHWIATGYGFFLCCIMPMSHYGALAPIMSKVKIETRNQNFLGN